MMSGRKKVNCIVRRATAWILTVSSMMMLLPMLLADATALPTASDRDIALVLDTSGSMEGEPIEQTKEAASKFVDTVFEQNSMVGLVGYDSSSEIYSSLTQDAKLLKEEIDGLCIGGRTDMYSGLENADQVLKSGNSTKKIIVLMSDGCPNEGPEENGSFEEALIRYAKEMKDSGYLIYTLGFFSSLDTADKYAAQSLMESIASPGLHFEVDSVDNLVWFFNDIADQISGKQYVYVRIACPVNVTVKSGGETLSSVADSENTRTTFGTLTYETVQAEESDSSGQDGFEGSLMQQEASSGEIQEDKVKILRLDMDKDYDIDISGYADGSMDYTVIYPDANGEYTDVRKFPGITVTATMKATANTALEDESYLKVDANGDGKYEKTYKTKSNGAMEEVKDHRLLFICIGAGCVVLVIIIVIIVHAVRSSSKKRKTSGMIVGLFGGLQGYEYPIATGQICTIGRQSDNDLCILHKNSKVSRHHCTIQLLPNGMYRVTDYSSNGTYSNNQRLPEKIPCDVPRGSLIVIGTPDNVIELR